MAVGGGSSVPLLVGITAGKADYIYDHTTGYRGTLGAANQDDSGYGGVKVYGIYDNVSDFGGTANGFYLEWYSGQEPVWSSVSINGKTYLKSNAVIGMDGAYEWALNRAGLANGVYYPVTFA